MTRATGDWLRRLFLGPDNTEPFSPPPRRTVDIDLPLEHAFDDLTTNQGDR